jgi:transglutaminase-like putative cysteine protease
VMRVLSWPIRQLRPRALLSLALLLVTLGCVALGLAGAVRELDAPLMLTVAVVGLLAGWILALAPLRSWIALALASTSGLVVVFLRVGRLGEKLAALLQALAGLAGEAFRRLLSAGDTSGLPPRPPLGWEPVLLVLEELQTGAGALLTRVRDWSAALAAGEPTFDPAAAALVWSLAVWVVGAWAGWTTRRRARPLLAVTPAGVLLLATFYYGGEAHTLLPVVLGAILLLLAVLTRDARIRRWQAAGVGPVDNGGRTARVVVFLTLALVAAAATVPSLSVEQIVELIRDRDKERGAVDDLVESLGVERPKEPVPEEIAVFDQVRTTGLARRHLVGSGPELVDQRVMIIKTDDPLPVLEGPELMELEEQDALPSVPRYYWRSRTYDLYVYFGWYTGDTEVVEYRAGKPAITATVGLTFPQRTVQQEVKVVGDLRSMIHVAGTLVAVDQDYNVAWRAPGDAFAATTGETAYRAESMLPVFTVERLQAAGTDYPDWVRSRYLWLPDTVPERVLALARDLTAAEPTPYDRAYAIETYLRGFPYNLGVPTPPSDRDVADYFLFELQEGYCDYYATAMVVLARAAGVPARYVAGYATGTYDYTKGQYVVTEANAHAWVEVYFPGYGWVEFEPTAGLPAIERPTEEDVESFEPPPRLPEPEEATTRPWWGVANWPRWLAGMAGLALLAVVGVAWMAVDTWWLRRLRPAATVATLYGRFWRQARRLTVPMQVSDTPYEFAAAFAKWAADLSREEYWGEWMMPTAQNARHLVDCYVQTTYASRLLNPLDQRRVIQTWQKLRWHLWLAQARRTRLFGRRLFD